MIAPILPLVIFAGLIGLAIGSFLNVVIHRLPQGESVVRPRSHCPACGKILRPWDNIPLLSYVLLRGRCRDCGASIPLRYPLVELLTGLLFAMSVVKCGPTLDALLEAVFGAALLALIFIDAREQLLPDRITLPLALFALLATTWRGGWGEPIVYPFDLSLVFSTPPESLFPMWRAAIAGGLLIAAVPACFWLIDRLDIFLFNKYYDWDENADLTAEERAEWDKFEQRDRRMKRIMSILGLASGVIWALLAITQGRRDPLAWNGAWSGLTGALTGALVGALPLWWLRTFYFLLRGVEGLGLGDVKLLAGIGAFLGWQGALSVLLLGSIFGSVVGLWIVRRSSDRLHRPIPFGCFLGAAALMVLFKQVI